MDLGLYVQASADWGDGKLKHSELIAAVKSLCDLPPWPAYIALGDLSAWPLHALHNAPPPSQFVLFLYLTSISNVLGSNPCYSSHLQVKGSSWALCFSSFMVNCSVSPGGRLFLFQPRVTISAQTQHKFLDSINGHACELGTHLCHCPCKRWTAYPFLDEWSLFTLPTLICGVVYAAIPLIRQ